MLEMRREEPLNKFLFKMNCSKESIRGWGGLHKSTGRPRAKIISSQ